MLQLKKQLDQIRYKKVRIFIAIAIFTTLFSVSSKFLSGGGVNKRSIMFLLLSFLTGIFTAFPMPFRKYLSIPFSICYLLVIPLYTFRRIELPLHDMGAISDSAEIINILIILFVWAVLLLVFQRTNLAFGIGGILLLVYFVVNYYVTSFRGSGISFHEIKAAGTAISVMGNYDFAVSEELWYSVLYFLFFIAFGLWCKVPFKGKIYHWAVTLISIAYIAFFAVSGTVESI